MDAMLRASMEGDPMKQGQMATFRKAAMEDPRKRGGEEVEGGEKEDKDVKKAKGLRKGSPKEGRSGKRKQQFQPPKSGMVGWSECPMEKQPGC